MARGSAEIRHFCGAGLFEDSDREFAIDGREVGEKDFDRISGVEVLEQDSDLHPGAGDHRGSPEDFRVATHDWSFRFRLS